MNKMVIINHQHRLSRLSDASPDNIIQNANRILAISTATEINELVYATATIILEI